MEKELIDKQLQKYLPFILIAVTIIVGGYLLVQRGILTLPSFIKKSKIVDIGSSSIVDILFTGKEFNLSYASASASLSIDIAKFDKTEQWQGAGSIEENRTLGRNVLSLIDRDRKKVRTYLLKDFNLAPIDKIKFTVDLKSDPDDFESLSFLFGNKQGTNFYRFPITNLVLGINYFSIPKHRFFLIEGPVETEVDKTATKTVESKKALSWDKIERVQIELISRPASKASVEIDWIRGEKEDIFKSDWNWDGTEHFFNLDRTDDGKLVLLVQDTGGKNVGTLRKVSSVKNFSYSAKITTLKKGSVGLFFRGDYKTGYGYYLSVGGLGTNTWLLSKLGITKEGVKPTILLDGQISNFEFSKDQPFWLKIVTRGTSLSAYFSLDGEGYTKLGGVNDNQFDAGGVGVATSGGGAAYFDDFNLTKK